METHRYAGRSERRLTVLAQDPSVQSAPGKAVMTRVTVPAESIAAGPKGHRVHVIDFDTSTGIQYAPTALNVKPDDEWDPYAGIDRVSRLVGDPHFHQHNVYAIVMATLFDFETALGRHVSWGFDDGTHHIKVAPHAFADANAFYSRRDEGLMFGYFPAGGDNVFTCLSYDIIAHETTHAILDGLRRQFDRPSSADQAAFHEGFADIVALFSVLRSEEMIGQALLRSDPPLPRDRAGRYEIAPLLRALRRHSFLFGLAEEMGAGLDPLRRDALRRSVELTPSPEYLDQTEFQEAHRRGEILVAALIHAFLGVWRTRLEGKIDRARAESATSQSRYVEPWRVLEEGASAAQHLLRMAIRAVDYMPPLDIEFGDFLSALLTADKETVPDDRKYDYRKRIAQAFESYGIAPASPAQGGVWDGPKGSIIYGHAHAEPMRWDKEALHRFLWENRKPFELDDDALTLVESVRPVARAGSDGFVLRENVVEYYQLLDLKASELGRVQVKKPKSMPDSQTVRLYGSGTMVFDEFGHVKYHIGTGLRGRRQSQRQEQLWLRGAYAEGKGRRARRFAQLHLDRRSDAIRDRAEQW